LDSALTFSGLRICRKPVAAAQLLLQLPAAALIPGSDLARLCGCVVEQCSDDRVADELLQLLQGEGGLPGTEQLASLITACLRNREDESAAACILLLCSDPAAQSVDGSTAQGLLLEAVEAQQPQALQVLLQCLPAAEELGNEQVQQLLQATVTATLECDLCCGVVDSWLEALKAVAGRMDKYGISATLLLQLLQQAVRKGAAVVVLKLVNIKRLQPPGSAQVGSLLQLAVREQQYSSLHALLQLPHAAASLTADQTAQVLQASVQKDDHRMVGLLCGMQSAQLLQPKQVAGLLAAAVRQAKSPKSVVMLCKLPAAQRIAAASIAGLLDDAHVALKEIREAVEKEKAEELNSSTRRMMDSTPYSEYSPKKVRLSTLSPSQVARQTVAAATGAVQAEQRVPPRVRLGMQVVAALQELQAAARTRG
jgi:hypothetical protein